jgi:hydrogenase maturation protease
VRVLDGGTLGLALLPYIEEARAVILVDAVRADEPPGTLLRMEGDQVGPAVAGRLSVHQIGVADLLDAAMLLGKSPPSLTLMGIVPETIEVGLGLSPAVERRLSELVAAVIEEAGTLGFELAPRDIQEPAMVGAGSCLFG